MEKAYVSLRQLDHHENRPIRVYLNQEPDDYPAHWHRKYEIILPVQECYSVAVDDDPRAVYFDQVRNGRYIRMALITKLLEENP